MKISSISPKYFEKLGDDYHEEFVALSRAFILKNEIFVKKVNKMCVKSESTELNVYVSIVCLNVADNEICVSPGLFYELSKINLLNNVNTYFTATSGEKYDAKISELKLQRCFDQNHVKVDNRNTIDHQLIETLKRNYGDRYFRHGMYIPIIALGAISWFRVISNESCSFKLSKNCEYIIDNKTFEAPFSLGYEQYSKWHTFYSKKLNQFEYGDNWPAYKDIVSLLSNQSLKKGLLLYSETNGESVGLFGKTHMIKTFANCNGFAIIQIGILDVCIDNDDMKGRYMKLKAMIDTYAEILDQRVELDNNQMIMFLFKDVHLLFPKEHEYDSIDLRIYNLFQKILAKFNIIFTSNSLENTNMDCVRSLCVKEIYIELLTEEQRYDLLKQSDLLEYISSKSPSVDPSLLETIAKTTNTFTPYMLTKLITQCKLQCLDAEHSIKVQIDKMKKIKATKAGAPTVPKVLWEDIGGLSQVKDEIIKTLTPKDTFEKKFLKDLDFYCLVFLGVVKLY